ncbi:hypothetical protein FACS189475_09420 [Betaproteobacteria bacterium]|nr:hypothetical protein FACS189475_09420 [Betaproteobacteria bacterium]
MEIEFDPAKLPIMIGRPPYEEPKKMPVTIRMDVDVIAALKVTGKGWQTRVNEAMREWVKTHA